MGAEVAIVVGGAFVERSLAGGGTLAALLVPWTVIVLSLETTSLVCLVLVGMRVLGCCSLGLAWANTIAWGCCSLGLVLAGAVVLGCCLLGLALAGAVVLGFG